MLWNNKKTNLSLICDIGSATVSIAVIDFTAAKPLILFTTIVPIKIEDVYNAKKLESNLLSYFEQAIKNVSVAFRSELKTLSEKQIREAVLIFSSPWYIAKTRNITVNKQNAFFLDAHTVEDLINAEEKKFEHEAISGTYKSIGNRDVRMIERELVRVRLNGYETAAPYMKRVRNAELSLYMSLVPHTVLKTITDLLADKMHVGKIKAFTFPLVSFGAIRKLFPHEVNYLLVDVAGEMTDVTCVRERIVIGSKPFLSGRNALIRDVAKKMNVSSEIALSYLSMYASDALEEVVKKKLQYSLDIFFADWKKQYIQVIKFLDPATSDGGRVFLSVDGDVSGLFLKNLNNVSAINAIDAIFLSDEVLANSLSYEKYIGHDPFIGIEAVFLTEQSSP
jgi:hypothetical protein